MRLIDKDALKKDVLALRDCYNGFSDTYDKACIIGVIDEQPTIEPERWIPVTERLPEDVEIGEEYPTVIFCTKDATYSGFYEHYMGGKWWCGDEDYTVDEVIAWMPLPEPYRGDQNDSH